MTEAPYHLFQPATLRSGVVFASPHSSSAYPESFLRRSQLDKRAIRSSEDAFVDQLFSCAPEQGAPLITAGVPRAYVDMNRSTDELDPALIEGARRHGHNPRVASGLGVIPRVVANGRAIYAGRLPMAEAQGRIARYWHPYHMALQQLLDAARSGFGRAILIDCHSMPHEAIEGASRAGRPAPQIVLGDRFGAAANGDIVDQVEAAFLQVGLRVARNAPFAGAYVTQAYGRPSRNQHAIQVEIDRSLYMDERRIEPNEGFEPLRDALRQVVSDIAAIGGDAMPLAAE